MTAEDARAGDARSQFLDQRIRPIPSISRSFDKLRMRATDRWRLLQERRLQ
jgi:hypothetical protein